MGKNAYLLFFVGFFGCVVVNNGGETNYSSLPPLPVGSRPRVAVVKKFDLDPRIYSYGYQGLENLVQFLPEQFEAELLQTGRFELLDRMDIREVMQEQDFGASDRVDPRTAAKLGRIQQAEYLITVRIVELRLNESSGAIGGVTHGFGLGVGYKRSSVAMLARVVHVETGRVVFSRIERASATSYGLVSATVFTVSGRQYWMAGGGFYKTPIGQAMKECMKKLAWSLASAVGRAIPYSQR